jgi:hypothetical protein
VETKRQYAQRTALVPFFIFFVALLCLFIQSARRFHSRSIATKVVAELSKENNAIATVLLQHVRSGISDDFLTLQTKCRKECNPNNLFERASIDLTNEFSACTNSSFRFGFTQRNFCNRHRNVHRYSSKVYNYCHILHIHPSGA